MPGLVLGLCWACAGLVGLCARKPVPRSTSAGTLGAFGASRSAPLGALPFGPCVPWALRPFLRTPAVMFLVFDFSGGDALRRVAPLRLLRGRVSAENELLKCSVFVGRDKHANVGK